MAEKRATTGEEPASKRQHVEMAPKSEGAMQSIIEVQEKLKQIDDECVKEQMNIQKMYDKKKQPLFEDRQKHIERIPNFWGQALWEHPHLCWISEDDKAILKHLKNVEVEDSLDVHGSYRIKMVFGEEANEYFEPLELVKHVVFKPDPLDPEAEDVRVVEDVTEIKFKEEKDVRLKARKAREAGEDALSFFEWFAKTDEEMLEEVDIGELLRRGIWHTPHVSYLGEWEESADDTDTDSDGGGDDGESST